MTASPTGDTRMDKLLPLAERLVRAAHSHDQLGIATAFADADLVYDDEPTALRALVVLLAAMCPDDATPSDLLEWRVNPTEYRRLRALNVPAEHARTLACRVTELIARKGA